MISRFQDPLWFFGQCPGRVAVSINTCHATFPPRGLGFRGVGFRV